MALSFRYYVTSRGDSPFESWLDSIRDPAVLARIRLRLHRVALGNWGDCQPLGEGLLELRLDFGPGYRIYFAREGNEAVILYAGGHKGTQRRDIERAKGYHRDYKARQTQAHPQRG